MGQTPKILDPYTYYNASRYSLDSCLNMSFKLHTPSLQHRRCVINVQPLQDEIIQPLFSQTSQLVSGVPLEQLRGCSFPRPQKTKCGGGGQDWQRTSCLNLFPAFIVYRQTHLRAYVGLNTHDRSLASMNDPGQPRAGWWAGDEQVMSRWWGGDEEAIRLSAFIVV